MSQTITQKTAVSSRRLWFRISRLLGIKPSRKPSVKADSRRSKKAKHGLTRSQESESAPNKHVTPLNPVTFFTAYLPDYFRFVCMYGQRARFFRWAILEGLSKTSYLAFQYCITRWNESMLKRLPLVGQLPLYASCLLLSSALEISADWASRLYYIYFKEAIQSQLIQCIHHPRGQDLLKKSQRQPKEPMLTTKLDSMMYYIEMLGTLALLSAIALPVLLPAIQVIYTNNLLAPALYTAGASLLVVKLGLYLSRDMNTYMNDSQNATNRLLVNLTDQENLDLQHLPNSSLISQVNCETLNKKNRRNIELYYFYQSATGFLSKALDQLSRPFIAVLFVYPLYATGIIADYTMFNLLLGALVSISSLFSRCMNGNASFQILESGYHQLKACRRNIIAPVQDDPDKRETLEFKSTISTTVDPSRDHSEEQLEQLNIRITDRDDKLFRDYKIPMQADDKHFIVVGKNGAGKSTLQKAMDNTYAQSPESEKNFTVLSLSQCEDLPDFIADGDAKALLYYYWPFKQPANKDNIPTDISVADYNVASIFSRRNIVDTNGSIVEYNKILASLLSYLDALQFNGLTDSKETFSTLSNAQKLEHLNKPKLYKGSGGERKAILIALFLAIAEHVDQPVTIFVDEVREGLDVNKNNFLSKTIKAYLEKQKHVKYFEILHSLDEIVHSGADKVVYVNGSKEHSCQVLDIKTFLSEDARIVAASQTKHYRFS